MYRTIVLFLLVFSGLSAISQPRVIQTINSNWKFHKGDIDLPDDTGSWEKVNIPHTWNATDVLDDEPGYYRGVGWYEKELYLPSSMKDKKIYLFFEGANQDAQIFLNNREIGVHHGGYTSFCFDITGALRPDQSNVLRVKLDNSYNDDVPPVGGDLCHFGGIYRDVSLVALESTHFDIGFFASSGVFITTPEVNSRFADVNIQSRIVNSPGQDFQVRHTILSPEDEIVATIEEEGQQEKETLTSDFRVKKPLLWTPSHPHLYQVRSRIIDNDGNVLDEVVSPLGFRSISAHADKGIMINGEPLFIRGIGKHQDYDKRGYAVPEEVAVNDVLALKEMGANLVRSHYPLDPVVYDLCDEKGIMVWGKIPIMDKITHSKAFEANAKNMMKELMYQNFNRPSFVLWGFACEIFGDMDWYWPRPKKESDIKENLEKTEAFSKRMEKFIRDIDPYRLTANDFHTDPTPEYYKRANQETLNMVNGWNLYQGWYHNNLDSIGWAFETFRDYNPDVPFLIAEFGAGSDPRIHTYNPTIFDFSIEYQDVFHQRYLREVEEYDFIHGMCVWTLVDFQVADRPDAVPHMNNKGMLSTDRKPKSSYYLYQAHWSEQPMVHIASGNWNRRQELVEGEYATRPVSVYSNQSHAELYLNGSSLGKKEIVNREAEWDVPFIEGQNHLDAVAADGEEFVKDHTDVDFTFVPEDMVNSTFPTRGICINVGQSRTYFTDELTRDVWMPDKKYKPGNFGHVDGRYYTTWNNMDAWDGIREGVDANIKGAEIDPVFQTFLVGNTRYQIDVPDGKYKVTLYFAEPFNASTRKNPEEKTGADKNGDRVFNVSVNNQTVFDNLNLEKQFGVQRSVTKSTEIDVVDNRINVQLTPVKGEPVLNGIQIRKL